MFVHTTASLLLLWTVSAEAVPSPVDPPAVQQARELLERQFAEDEALRQLDLRNVERNIIIRTNAERIRHGLRPLRISAGLMASARRHALWMAQARNLQHTRDMVAENIAWNQVDSGQAVRDWMNSPGHRANILASRYGEIGGAAFIAADGSAYWCQQFR